MREHAPGVDCRFFSPRARRGLRALALSTAGLLIAGSATVLVGADYASLQVVAQEPIERPGYLEHAIDRAFGTPFMRVTDPGKKILPGIACGASHCRHRYSSAQAWNADQSLLVISSGCPGLCFLDGQTYRPLFNLRAPGSCQWHPIDPDRMICVSEDQVYALSVRAGRYQRIFASGDLRGLRFGPGKGNLSRDGQRLVVRAINKDGRLVAFAYDIATSRKFPEIALDQLDGENSYCSISPSGRYVFCFQRLKNRTNTAYVFGVDGDLLQNWSEHHRPGHGDMTVDVDGRDVYVGISKSDPDRYRVIKRRLDDGAVTVLSTRGLAQHASIRNVNRPGWVFVTFGGTYNEVAERRDRLPFYQEIVALRLDGTGEARRIVQTHSVERDYTSEAHASPSPDGSQVIWASNWGQPGAPVASYVARVRWPDAPAMAPSPER
jgi:hypothetical protein